LFKDLDCQLRTLAIAMQAFFVIMDEIEVVNRNEDFTAIIDVRGMLMVNFLGLDVKVK